MQDLDGVRADRHTSAHLAQDAGLLVEVGIEAGLAQREGGGHAADPRADNDNAHGVSPSFLARWGVRADARLSHAEADALES